MQEFLKQNLKRSELLKEIKNLEWGIAQDVKINIFRNHSIEPITSVIDFFLHLNNVKASFNISSYDDSLNFGDFEQADLELVFVDVERYKGGFQSYLVGQLEILRSRSSVPILVLLLGLEGDFKHSVKECFVFRVEELLENIGVENIFDLEKFEITATRLSNGACLGLAQVLGLSIIPSFFLPHLKAIVLDLDNTLYSGVLGEDGIENIVCTKDHYKLHHKILEFKKQGYLLAIASKNQKEDVERLFKQRSDFGLKLEDFDFIAANWKEKRGNLVEIANAFNIGIDSILFVDDNIAEIENIKHIGVKYIHATSPKETVRLLELFPRLRKIRQSQEDLLRSGDIAANRERENLKQLSKDEYFKNLQIKLEFFIDKMEKLQRTQELLNKTNQFISNYSRPSLDKVKQWFNLKDYCIVDVAMSDRLSDSGIIAVIIGQKLDGELHIIDLCISCRALGRKLEEIILMKSCEFMCKIMDIKKQDILVHYQEGERNQPFLEFINELNIFNKSKNEFQIKLLKVDTAGLIIERKE